MDTEMGSIAEMLEATEEEPTPLQKEVGRIGRMLGIVVVVIAEVVAATVLMISDIRTAADVITVLLLGVSLAVGNIAGTNTVNILFILGLSALLTPRALHMQTLRFDLPVMTAVALVCVPVFWSGRRVTRQEGALFVGLTSRM
jgi:Ca2+/Na+ antiporter